MSTYVKVNDVHKQVTDCKVKVDGTWKQAVEMLVKENGEWKRAWKGNFVDLNVFHFSTTSYDIFEDVYDEGVVPRAIDLVGIDIKAYDHDGNVIAEYIGEQRNITSVDLNVNGETGTVASVGITPHSSFNKIQYSFWINDVSNVSMLTVKIAGIYIPS